MTRGVLERPVWTSPPRDGLGDAGRPRWRRAAVGVGVALVALLVGFGLIAAITGPGIAHRGAAAPVSTIATAPAAGDGLVRHAPVTVAPSGSPVQEQYDQALAAGLGSEAGMAAAGSLPVPAPAVTGGWPGLAVSSAPQSWAAEFVAGLLDVNYAHQSRAALPAWLQAQEAPELIPGVPGSVADKVLYISLLDPGLFGGQPTPLVSPPVWAADARAGVRQSVSGLVVQTDPAWAQMTAAGWQSADVRMAELDVSGLLTQVRAGRAASARFGLQLIVGSARWHDGYGTVAVAGWQVQAR